MNWILIGPMLSFVWWMYYGLAGDWKPSKKMPHWIAIHNQKNWLMAGMVMTTVIIAWAIIFP